MKTIKVKTAELEGAALDWATIRASENRDTRIESSYAQNDKGIVNGLHYWCWDQPSTNWLLGGHLIEKYQISIEPEAHDGRVGTENSDRWCANFYIDGGDQYSTDYCDTALIAVCRAVCLWSFGEEVSVPACLAGGEQDGN